MFEKPIDKIIESLGGSWAEVLGSEMRKSYFSTLLHVIWDHYANGRKPCHPAEDDIFNAFKFTPLEKVSVVIVGQDPYHGKGQAHGLAFSVNHKLSIPPSLKNIFKEIKANYPETPEPSDGDLTHWAEQGVLLLNTILTVSEGSPKSHATLGWETFTKYALKGLLLRTKPTVFMLWGRSAQQILKSVPSELRSQHLVLTANHPSPYSVDGFLGCQHFSKANDFLEENGFSKIEWGSPSR